MILPSDRNKYLAQFRYVELAHYVPSLNKVIREQTKDKQPILVDIDEVSQYAQRNQNKGIYTSVFQYRDKQITELALGPLYFDFDSSELERARQDAQSLVAYLTRNDIPGDGIRIYFTGYKGFHVEVEAITLGITPASNLPEVFRYVANQLTKELGLSTVDTAVYDHRRMWRYPGSIHQRTGLYKCAIPPAMLDRSVIDIQQYASTPQVNPIPEVQFSLAANEWYRNFTYQLEESKQKTYTRQDVIDRFAKRGTSDAIDPYDDREFDPVKLFENCPSIMRLWEKAEKEHNLEHMERLFLCSILTYTDEAIGYLHSILSSCDDYNWERSESHIRDWIHRRERGTGGRPFSCRLANDNGVGCGDCQDRLEAKPRYQRIGDKLYPTEEMAEISPIRFAYGRKK